MVRALDLKLLNIYLHTYIKTFKLSNFFKMDVDTAIMLCALIIKKRNKKIKRQRLLRVHSIVSP